jgi:hypothetical protein
LSSKRHNITEHWRFNSFLWSAQALTNPAGTLILSQTPLEILVFAEAGEL